MGFVQKVLNIALLATALAATSPAMASQSSQTTQSQRAFKTSIRHVQQTQQREDILPMLQHLVAYLTSLARDIERDIEQGKFEDAQKELALYTRELKFLKDLRGIDYGGSLKVETASKKIAKLVLKRVEHYLAEIEAAIIESEFEKIIPIRKKYKALIQAMELLDQQVDTRPFAHKSIRLAKRALLKVHMPPGTYVFKQPGFEYTVTVSWNNLSLKILGSTPQNKRVQRPTKKQLEEMSKGKPEGVVNYAKKVFFPKKRSLTSKR